MNTTAPVGTFPKRLHSDPLTISGVTVYGDTIAIASILFLRDEQGRGFTELKPVAWGVNGYANYIETDETRPVLDAHRVRAVNRMSPDQAPIAFCACGHRLLDCDRSRRGCWVRHHASDTDRG